MKEGKQYYILPEHTLRESLTVSVKEGEARLSEHLASVKDRYRFYPDERIKPYDVRTA